MSVPDEKLPWFKFFPTDWLGDSHLQATSPATRGIWSNFLAHMKRRGTGELTGNMHTLARLGACTADEVALFLAEMATEEAANVFELGADGARLSIDGHALVTPDVTRKFVVVSRRLSREARKKKTDAARQDRRRAEKSRSDVTQEVADESRDDESAHAHARSSEIRVSLPSAPAHARVIGAWGKKQLHDLWIEVVKKTPSGNTVLLDELAERIASSARARNATDVEDHATRLLQSFAAIVDGWRDAKRPRPQKSVEAFDRNFAACEEVIDGERDPRAIAVQTGSPHAGDQANRPKPPPVGDYLRRIYGEDAEGA